MLPQEARPQARGPTYLAFRKDIEGLRGLAVLMVVAFHSGQTGFSGGFVGVDVFFVISGYLISGLLIEEYRQQGRIDFLRFYARRARRLLPAAFLTFAGTLAVASFVLSPWELKDLGKDGLWAALSFSNVWFAVNAADYFAPDVNETAFIHTWSLAVEEQFYLAWPVLILTLMAVIRSDAARLWLLAIITLLTLLACVVMTDIQQVWAFYGTPFRVWEFALGAIAYLVKPPAGDGAGRVLVYLGIALVISSGLLLDQEMAFPGFYAVAPVLGTCLILLGSAAAPASIPVRCLQSRPMQTIGTLSYSWYLWHWPFLVLGPLILPEVSQGVLTPALVGASFLLAWMTFRLVEHPIRRHPALVRSSGRSLTLGASLICLGMLAGLFSYGVAKLALTEPIQVAIAKARNDVSDRDCIAELTDTEAKSCVHGSDQSGVIVALFGDSHAHQWLPALKRVAERENWRVATFLKSACPTAEVTFYYDKLKRVYEECSTWRKKAMEALSRMAPAAIIVVNASSGYASDNGIDRPLNYQDWEEGLRRNLAGFADVSLPIILIRDNPRPQTQPALCLSRAIFQGQRIDDACRYERSQVVNDAIYEAELRALQSRPNTHTIDFTDWFCDDLHCPSYRDEIVMYRDGNHLSRDAVLALVPALRRQLADIVERGSERSDRR